MYQDDGTSDAWRQDNGKWMQTQKVLNKHEKELFTVRAMENWNRLPR